MVDRKRAVPGWVQEFEALKPTLTAHLVRRGLAWLVDDVLGKVAVELSQLSNNEELPVDAIARKGLIWRIVRFRARDALRSQFVKSVRGADSDELDELGAQGQTIGFDESSRVDARRLLLAVARCVDQLPAEDRQLVTRDLDNGQGDAMSTRERVRLLRLRRAIAKQVLGGGEGGT